ncbi:surface antigen [Glaciihabitans tibetensis]|uniref:Surface antigen n=1 Tax=Glaciihabitans tibetensis TaxID=1266600 RepID=A0A2T0VAJ0_9MICO|nr:CHAP domain-containing protein [Glaciihabitans tibetensis]PRY67210.1 surface antigen [Glaciihabitans tibetensis]
MLEATTPDSSDAVRTSQDSTPQYASRREARAALEREARRPAKAVAVPVTVVPAGPAVASVHAAPRTAKPTRAERGAARRLTAPERTVAVAPRVSPSKKQKPAVVLITLLAVPGFLASASLPAFAFAPAGSEHQAEISEAADALNAANGTSQELAVGNTVVGAQVQQDAITATSEAELKAAQVAAAAALKAEQLAAAALASYSTRSSSSSTTGTVSGTVSSVRAAGDDYPWPSAGNTLSPLNYYYRQCVDFVAWRLNRDAGSMSAPWKYVWSNLTPTGGNASAWKSAWAANGWTISSTPVTGSVAWFNGNHVAYVKEVVGSNVIIEEYNGMAKLAYAIRTIPISSVASYLYPPPR